MIVKIFSSIGINIMYGKLVYIWKLGNHRMQEHLYTPIHVPCVISNKCIHIFLIKQFYRPKENLFYWNGFTQLTNDNYKYRKTYITRTTAY